MAYSIIIVIFAQILHNLHTYADNDVKMNIHKYICILQFNVNKYAMSRVVFVGGMPGIFRHWGGPQSVGIYHRSQGRLLSPALV